MEALDQKLEQKLAHTISECNQVIAQIENEINSFVTEDNKKNPHKKRDAFSRSHMLQYAQKAKKTDPYNIHAEELFKNLKLARCEQYIPLNRSSVNE